MPKPADWWISPHFTQGDVLSMSVDQKVAVFADRIRGWILDPAQRLLHADPHGGFAALAVLGTYFEMVAKYQDGRIPRGDSERYFTTGVTEVLTNTTGTRDLHEENLEVAALLYQGLRNGLYHGGFPAKSIGVSGDIRGVLSYNRDAGQVIINPSELALAIQRHFSKYVAVLVDPGSAELRRKFESRFDSEFA
jgi:hypothetical protein